LANNVIQRLMQQPADNYGVSWLQNALQAAIQLEFLVAEAVQPGTPWALGWRRIQRRSRTLDAECALLEMLTEMLTGLD
jgi:hypothetical protein